MIFLALAPWQAMTLLALTAAAVIVLFFLRLQHRRQPVASIILWRRVLERQRKRSLLEWLRRLLSLLLALAIASAMALALGEPEPLGAQGRPRSLAIVVDTGLTMRARSADGRSRWDHALDRAHEVIMSTSRADTLLVGDTSGRVLSPPSRDRRLALDALQRMVPHGIQVGVPTFGPGVEMIFISDGVARYQLPPETRTLSVFEAADNVGITAFSVRALPSDPLRLEAFLEVSNFSPAAKGVEIRLGDSGDESIRRAGRLEPGQSYRGAFDVSVFRGGVVQATVNSPDDALTVDDVAYDYMPRRRLLRALLVSDDNPHLQDLLASDSTVDVVSLSPERLTAAGSSRAGESEAAGSSEYDVLILDRHAPDQKPVVPALLFQPPEVDWLPPRRGAVQAPETVLHDTEHPLLRNLSFEDVAVDLATRTALGGGELVVGTEDAPLIVAGDEAPRWVLVNFALRDTDFVQSADFPVFLRNALEWLRGEQAVVRRPLGTAMGVPYAVSELQAMDGSRVRTSALLGQTLFDVAEPGIWFANNASSFAPIAVNTLDARVSDINRSVLDQLQTQLEEDPGTQRRPLWQILLLLALALVTFEAWTYHRRITL